MEITLLFCLLVLFGNLTSGENLNYSDGRTDLYRKDRLPGESYPIRYDIEITTNVHTGEKAFQGKVIIEIVIVKASKDIRLHAYQLDITSVTLTYSNTDEMEELLHDIDEQLDQLKLLRKNNENFAAGSQYNVTITYSGVLNEKNIGFGFYKYNEDDGEDHYLAGTYLENQNARGAFPCYDELDKPAEFTITINHGPIYSAVSNMLVNTELSRVGKTVFNKTDLILPSNVVFVVTDLEYTEITLRGKSLRVYSRASARKETEWILVAGLQILEYLIPYLGVELKLPKLDYIILPDFITDGVKYCKEANFKYNEVNSSISQQHDATKLLATMITTQLLKEYVVVEWWSSYWWMHGLAMLFATKALDYIYPERAVWPQFNILYHEDYMISESSTQPITLHVQTRNEFNKMNEWRYRQRAVSVIFMWLNALTDKVFQQAMQSFLKNSWHKVVTEQQFIAAIQDVANNRGYMINEMMSTWTHQTGFPLLTITRNYIDGTFHVKQEPFHDNEDKKTWYVPINYAVAASSDFRDTQATHYLLNVAEMKIDAGIDKSDWFVVDKQSSGLYRIKYDLKNYDLITDCLIQTPFRIPSRSRAKILADAFALSKSNRLENSILLKILTYLKREDQYEPWNMAYKVIKYFYKYLYNEGDFISFAKQLVNPIFQKLYVDEIPGEHHNDKYIRKDLMHLACRVGVESCLIAANKKLKNLIYDNIPIDPI